MVELYPSKSASIGSLTSASYTSPWSASIPRHTSKLKPASSSPEATVTASPSTAMHTSRPSRLVAGRQRTATCTGCRRIGPASHALDPEAKAPKLLSTERFVVWGAR
eukprot:scaffold48864_cov63-Phaeocystis_antarctica.AAC.1